MTITIIDWFSWIYAGLDDFNVLDDMHHLLIITLLSSIVWIYSRFNHLTYLDDIHTSYTFNTHHLWLISRIRTRFRQYPRINYFGNLWRYHGFTDIDARYHWVVHFAFDDDIQELVTFWRWLAFEHFTDFADIEHFLIILQCCTRYDDIDHISPIDDVTIFSIRFD
jgi:hypothetical protein